MNLQEAEKELDKIISYAEQLIKKDTSITDLLVLMARMQCSQTRLIMFLMLEIQRLKL